MKKNEDYPEGKERMEKEKSALTWTRIVMSISRHDDYSLEKKKGGKFTEYITAQLTLEL